MNLPDAVLTFVQRLLRPEKTWLRLDTSPLRPLPLGPFFAMRSLYRPRRTGNRLSPSGKYLSQPAKLRLQFAFDAALEKPEHERKLGID